MDVIYNMAKIEKKKIVDLPIFLLTKASECPYISSRIEKRLATDITNVNYLHDKLALSGFRRVENWMYRPACDNCNECKAYRVKTKEFIISKGFKRILNKNYNIDYKILPNKALKSYFSLFKKYQKARHFGGSMSMMKFSDFRAMIEVSPVNTKIIEYRNEKNILLGVMLIDYQNDGLSAVYSFYNPEYNKNGLGNYMILKLIDLARSINLKYVYLGYYIKNVEGMNYKNRFNPGEIYQDGKWIKHNFNPQ